MGRRSRRQRRRAGLEQKENAALDRVIARSVAVGIAGLIRLST